MKLGYDKEVNVTDIKTGKVKQAIELNDSIIIDFDDKGKILGVEILDTNKVINKKVILEAQSF